MFKQKLIVIVGHDQYLVDMPATHKICFALVLNVSTKH